MVEFQLSGACSISKIYQGLRAADDIVKDGNLSAGDLSANDVFVTSNAGPSKKLRVYAPEDIQALYKKLQKIDARDGKKDGGLAILFKKDGAVCPRDDNPSAALKLDLKGELLSPDFADSITKSMTEYSGGYGYNKPIGHLQEIAVNHLVNRVGESALKMIAASPGALESQPFDHLSIYLTKGIDKQISIKELASIYSLCGFDIIEAINRLHDCGVLKKLSKGKLVKLAKSYENDLYTILQTTATLVERGIMKWMSFRDILGVAESCRSRMDTIYGSDNQIKFAELLNKLHQRKIDKALGKNYFLEFLCASSFGIIEACEGLLAYYDAKLNKEFGRKNLMELVRNPDIHVGESLKGIVGLKKKGTIQKIGVPALMKLARNTDDSIGNSCVVLGEMVDVGLIDQFGVDPFITFAGNEHSNGGSEALSAILRFHQKRSLTSAILNHMLAISEHARYGTAGAVEGLRALAEAGRIKEIGWKGILKLNAASEFGGEETFKYLATPKGRALLKAFSIDDIVAIDSIYYHACSVEKLFDGFVKAKKSGTMERLGITTILEIIQKKYQDPSSVLESLIELDKEGLIEEIGAANIAKMAEKAGDEVDSLYEILLMSKRNGTLTLLGTKNFLKVIFAGIKNGYYRHNRYIPSEQTERKTFRCISDTSLWKRIGVKKFVKLAELSQGSYVTPLDVLWDWNKQGRLDDVVLGNAVRFCRAYTHESGEALMATETLSKSPHDQQFYDTIIRFGYNVGDMRAEALRLLAKMRQSGLFDRMEWNNILAISNKFGFDTSYVLEGMINADKDGLFKGWRPQDIMRVLHLSEVLRKHHRANPRALMKSKAFIQAMSYPGSTPVENDEDAFAQTVVTAAVFLFYRVTWLKYILRGPGHVAHYCKAYDYRALRFLGKLAFQYRRSGDIWKVNYISERIWPRLKDFQWYYNEEDLFDHHAFWYCRNHVYLTRSNNGSALRLMILTILQFVADLGDKKFIQNIEAGEAYFYRYLTSDVIKKKDAVIKYLSRQSKSNRVLVPPRIVP